MPGASGSATSARPAAESSPMCTRAVARAARAARSSGGRPVRDRGAAEPDASCSSSGQAPRAKRSQRRSSSAGGMSESPPERWRSIRGARQKSFQPRSSCTGDSRSAISCKPAQRAVRRAPRRRRHPLQREDALMQGVLQIDAIEGS